VSRIFRVPESSSYHTARRLHASALSGPTTVIAGAGSLARSSGRCYDGRLGAPLNADAQRQKHFAQCDMHVQRRRTGPMDYTIYGMRVVSDFELLGPLPWTGVDRSPDVEIRLGRLESGKRCSDLQNALLTVMGNGACRLELPDIATFLVEDVRRIIVDPVGDPETLDVQVFLLGSAFGYLCHLRGLLPLHAGSVEIGGHAIAFAGPSGSGKSTLVAALVQAGHRMVADDMTVVDPHAPGGPLTFPAFPRMKLWNSTIDGLGIARHDLMQIRQGLAKFSAPVRHDFANKPLPLGAVYHLTQTNDPMRSGIASMAGREAMAAILDSIHRRRAAVLMGKQPALFQSAVTLAQVPNARLTQYPDLSALQDTAKGIAARHAA